MSQSLNRRRFGKLLATSAALPLVAAARSPAPASSPATLALIKPVRLRAGDTIGLLTPSGHVADIHIEKSIANLQSLGLQTKLGKHVREARGNYAGTAQQRLEDLHAMFADPQIKGIWAMVGGSGAISLLDGLDYELIRKNPKVLVGCSDTTALHLAIHRRTGLVTFHGPVAAATWSDYSLANLRSVLMEPATPHIIRMSEENRQRAAEAGNFGLRTLRAGVAQGRLMGGNLSLFSALTGTPYGADIAGRILFLEDVGEAPYRIDRMMTQVNLAGGFQQTAGVMLGIFERCEAKEGERSLTLAQTIDDHLAASTVPAAYGYSFGHIRHQFTIPMGVMAMLDTENQTLVLLEAAVR